MNQHTALYESHVAAGARMVAFGGWMMPLHYGSQVQEHHAVRRRAGMFDVSHMTRVDLRGAGARPFLRRLVANNVDKLTERGKALYTCMLNDQGGVLDDLIVYFLDEDWFRLVVNAATRDKDLAWINDAAAAFADVEVGPRPELAMIAVQGPEARARSAAALGDGIREAAGELPPFHAVTVGEYFVSTTGYTGEDGFEIILPAAQAAATWQALLQSGVAPCGLGARDTLRLEAGMNLYGADMDEQTTPLESGLGWTVAWEPAARDFIGRGALERLRAQGVTRRLVGLVLEDRGVLRGHQTVICSGGAGEITSGSYSPTLERSIALARVPAAVRAGDSCQVEVRGRSLAARVVKYPFVRHGRSCLAQDQAE